MNVESFWNSNSDGLIQAYIIERKKHNNELGVLLSIIDEAKENTIYLTLSNNMLSDEIKKDVLEKNNDRNNKAFFCIIENKTNTSSLIVKDLE